MRIIRDYTRLFKNHVIFKNQKIKKSKKIMAPPLIRFTKIK